MRDTIFCSVFDDNKCLTFGLSLNKANKAFQDFRFVNQTFVYVHLKNTVKFV